MSVTYKIGEAASLLRLKTYVLRFWETEFPQIAPLRTEKGQRLYTAEHLALLEHIRYLLHERGLTIEGARKALAEEAVSGIPYAWPTSPRVDSPGEEPHGLAPSGASPADDTGPCPIRTQEAAENTPPMAEYASSVSPLKEERNSPLVEELETVARLLRGSSGA